MKYPWPETVKSSVKLQAMASISIVFPQGPMKMYHVIESSHLKHRSPLEIKIGFPMIDPYNTGAVKTSLLQP
jgi:hypothetical protein